MVGAATGGAGATATGTGAAATGCCGSATGAGAGVGATATGTGATGAIAVAWEGAGAARACEFSNVPFLEVRGMSDSANESPEAFFGNIPTAMRNVAQILGQLASFV